MVIYVEPVTDDGKPWFRLEEVDARGEVIREHHRVGAEELLRFVPPAVQRRAVEFQARIRRDGIIF